MTVCFDIMENLVLPKTAIDQAYYSRQLYLYVFAVVHHGQDNSQFKNDVFFMFGESTRIARTATWWHLL